MAPKGTARLSQGAVPVSHGAGSLCVHEKKREGYLVCILLLGGA
jgi:hypothetical protein